MSKKIKTGGPAFPRDVKWTADGSICQSGSAGMSLRAYAAIEAMKGICGHPNLGEICTVEEIAELALQQADALLEGLGVSA